MSDKLDVKTLIRRPAQTIEILNTYPPDRRVFINGYSNPGTTKVSHEYCAGYDVGTVMNIEIVGKEEDTT